MTRTKAANIDNIRVMTKVARQDNIRENVDTITALVNARIADRARDIKAAPHNTNIAVEITSDKDILTAVIERYREAGYNVTVDNADKWTSMCVVTFDWSEK